MNRFLLKTKENIGWFKMFYLQRAEGSPEHDEMKCLETGPDQVKSFKLFALPHQKSLLPDS